LSTMSCLSRPTIRALSLVPVTVTLRMSYAGQSPFYASDDLVVEFTLRIRYSSLTLTSEPETTPYGDNAQFRVFFADTDASGAGIANAQIVILTTLCL